MLPRIHLDSLDNHPRELVDAYRSEGGFIVPGLLSAAEVQTVLLEIIAIAQLVHPDPNAAIEAAAELGPLVLNRSSPSGIDPAPNSDSLIDWARRASRWVQATQRMRSDGQSLIYETISQTPLLHGIAASPAILNVMRRVLSDRLSIHQRLLVLMSLPRDGWHLGRWHQDYYYNAGPETTCTVYIPLQPVSQQNGGLLLAPGRHREGLLDHQAHAYDVPTKWNTIAPDIVATFSPLQQIELEAGDALFFHSLLPHAAQLNQTDDVRFVINLRYRDLLDPGYRAAGWKIPELTAAREALARAPQTTA